jgi:uncharacterized membrane protein YedE/YeeE
VSKPGSDKGVMRGLFETFFGKTWPMWVGGLLLGLGNICLFLVRSPWGGSGGYTNWGENLYDRLGAFGFAHVQAIGKHPYGLLNFVVVLGAFAGALLARKFAVRIAPPGELVKGLLGGILMALGATLGLGCTIGGFFSGWPALSGGAIVLAIGFVIGTYLGLRYLLWEMEKLPGISSGRSLSFLSGTGARGAWQPWLGGLVVVCFVVVSTVLYKADAVLTWFALIGLMLGMVCQRSRFCIVRAFREPFMTGDSAAPVGVMTGLLVGIFGFTVIKYMGVGASTPGAARALALTWVYAHFPLRALIGGIIFGVGMTIAGGCAVGTLWRVGEGHVKLWSAALGFALMGPISKKYLAPGFEHLLPGWAKQQVFLPDVLGYGGAVLAFAVLILLWYAFVKWNERTGRFTAV